MLDVIVVGAGIMGATAAQLLRKRGRQVLLLDSGDPLAATPASGGHIKQSWSGIEAEEFHACLDLLEEAWGLHEDRYQLRSTDGAATGNWTTMFRVDTTTVLKVEKTFGRVYKLETYGDVPAVHYVDAKGEPNRERCKLLLVAAGMGCLRLLPRALSEGRMHGRQGISFEVSCSLETGFIQGWAPYKQIVAHTSAPGIAWVGDGTAVKPPNWQPGKYEEKSAARCLEALGAHASNPLLVKRKVVGVRPYVQGKEGAPCLLEQIGPAAWLATGSGKLGTIASGYVARRLLSA